MPAQINAVRSSTAGYSTEIGSAQCRHRPRRRSQDTVGILSYQAIGRAQRGKSGRGRTTDWLAGSRTMQTVRKLPTIAPNRPSRPTTSSSSFTRNLVEKDARGHGDVQGFHAGGEGDGHPPPRDLIERGTHPSALDSEDER